MKIFIMPDGQVFWHPVGSMSTYNHSAEFVLEVTKSRKEPFDPTTVWPNAQRIEGASLEPRRKVHPKRRRVASGRGSTKVGN